MQFAVIRRSGNFKSIPLIKFSESDLCTLHMEFYKILHVPELCLSCLNPNFRNFLQLRTKSKESGDHRALYFRKKLNESIQA